MSPAPDPVFPAIQDVIAAHRAWSAATAMADAIKAKLADENATEQPVVAVEFAGATVGLRSHKAIIRFYRRAREGQGKSTPELDAAEARLHDAFDCERERIATARDRLGMALSDDRIAEARTSLLATQYCAARTVPTTVEGMRALIELAGRLPIHDHDQMKAALASLRAAAVALLPEASR